MGNAFSFITKQFKKKLGKQSGQKTKPSPKSKPPIPSAPDTAGLEARLQYVQKTLGESKDVIIREFKSGNDQVKLALVFIEGLADKNLIHKHIIEPILSDNQNRQYVDRMRPGNALNLIQKHIASGSEVSTVPSLKLALKLVLDGDTALLIDTEKDILVFGTRAWVKRAVDEPVLESVVRGPREGFTETLRDNTALLRRRIRHESLRLESMKAGRLTDTVLVLAYLNGLVNPRLLEEVRRRIAAIDTDSILESGYIQEFIQDDKWTVFPQLEYTERPDKAAAAILEGRVVILCENTPMALIVPTVFFQFIQAVEDYYEQPAIGATLVRLLRLGVLNIALMLPALYVAITTFHQEMLPTPLLLSIAANREGIPLPAVAEALLMETTFEVLREAGIRLPKAVGQAVSIVGGLVIGNAAIQAGIVSPAMVIVVATTAISSFAIPAFTASIALRLLRFPLIILGGIMGLYGVIIGLLVILIHLAGLQSFGVPYLTPLVHGTLDDMAGTFFRPPWWLALKRPRMLAVQDRKRQAKNMRPRDVPNDERELFHEGREE
jgi:spore germination protein KA